MALNGITALGQVAGPVIGGIGSGLSAQGPGLQLGRFTVHGGVGGTVAYDDLVRIENNSPVSDLSIAISPFGSIQTDGPHGRTLMLAYRPSFLMFVDNPDENNINHFGDLSFDWPMNRLTLSLRQNVAVASVIVRDIADRAIQKTFRTDLTANYDLSHLTSLNGGISYNINDLGESYINSQQWGEQIRLDYHPSYKFTVGGGVLLYQTLVDQGANQMSEGPLVRVNFVPSQNLTFTAQAGVQLVHYDDSSDTTVAQNFDISGSFTPQPGTTLTLTARRAEQASALEVGQNYTTTGFDFQIVQSFWRQFTATVGGGYNFADYYSTGSGQSTGRSDSYYTVRASLAWTSLERFTTAIFIDHTSNASSTGVYTYDHNIVGIQAGWSF